MSRPDIRTYHLIAFSLCACVLLALTTATPVRRHAEFPGYLEEPEYIPLRNVRQRLLASHGNRKGKPNFANYGMTLFGRRSGGMDGEMVGPIRIPDFDATLD